MKLEPPRWPEGPSICEEANLPAFQTKAAMAEFREQNVPHGTIIAEWECKVCGSFHYWGAGTDPSGGSSGTTRTAKHLESLVDKFWKSPVARTVKKKFEFP